MLIFTYKQKARAANSTLFEKWWSIRLDYCCWVSLNHAGVTMRSPHLAPAVPVHRRAVKRIKSVTQWVIELEARDDGHWKRCAPRCRAVQLGPGG